MENVYKFLKECGPFFVSTINGEKPATRPFGAVIKIEDNLYITTSSVKNVYNQIKKNSNIQIVALKNGTKNWLRIDGKAEEIDNLKLKQKMFDEYPILKERFSGINDKLFVLIKVKVLHYDFY